LVSGRAALGLHSGADDGEHIGYDRSVENHDAAACHRLGIIAGGLDSLA
jgi:hypothetical protein